MRQLEQIRVSLQIRMALEFRLAKALDIERSEDLPVMSIAEIVNLLFGLYGQTNFLGGLAKTASAIRELIGDELFWNRPKSAGAEVEVSTTVN